MLSQSVSIVIVSTRRVRQIRGFHMLGCFSHNRRNQKTNDHINWYPVIDTENEASFVRKFTANSVRIKSPPQFGLM